MKNEKILNKIYLNLFIFYLFRYGIKKKKAMLIHWAKSLGLERQPMRKQGLG